MPLPVPSTLDDALSPAWLTSVFERRFPGVQVTRATLGPIVSRVSTNARFRIECKDARPTGLPADLCVKGYFGDGWPARQAGEPEVRFYRDLAHATGIRTLECFYAEIDEETRQAVLITGDVVANGGVFLDARSSYTADQVAESLAQLARLHAATWCKPSWEHTPWLAPRMVQTLRARGVKEIRGNFDGPIGVGVPDDVRNAERLVESFRALAAEVEVARPWTVIHGDTHVGNVFLDSAGNPGFLDWQLAQRGAWYVDVGYHIASTLSVDDRRRSERDLLRDYLDRLSAAGVEVPAWDDAWSAMGRGIVHGFFLWGITLKVEPAVTAVLLERLGSAASDHDSFTLLG